VTNSINYGVRTALFGISGLIIGMFIIAVISASGVGQFKWFDYSASLSAFSANQLDAVLVTNGDNLVTASGGTQGM
ncbi:hypothetical protein RFZ32_07350, partial [Acinetobacter baumannii]|nr:hypothetical protein [Acinetobacter baumannii]